MSDTKEKILLAALHLFAQNGYGAVSVSDIAGSLGMTKSALYKHYQNKRDIFQCICARMERLDAERAQRFSLPEGTPGEMAEAYHSATLQQLSDFSRAQFRYWTEEDFPASFRKMLTVQQYADGELRDLYQQYLCAGPLGYVTDLLDGWGVPNARSRAVAFYAPMFLYYSLYDGAADPRAVLSAFDDHIARLCARWREMDGVQ